MKIFLISDIHSHDDFEPIRDIASECDMVLCSGDFTNFKPKEEGFRIAQKLAALNPYTFVVSGNCDDSGLEQLLLDAGISVHGRTATVKKGEKEFSIAGIGGSLPAPMATPNTWTEDDLAETLSGIRQAPDIIISHQPPYGCGDVVMKTMHVGSRNLAKYIGEKKPLLCLCGHIHEAFGVYKLGNTTVVNPGSYREGKYGVYNIDTCGCSIYTYPL